MSLGQLEVTCIAGVVQRLVLLTKSAFEATKVTTGFRTYSTVVRSESNFELFSAKFALLCVVVTLLSFYHEGHWQLVETFCLSDVLRYFNSAVT